MSESKSFTTLQVYREVEPTNLTRRFLSEVRGIADTIIAPVASAMIEADKTDVAEHRGAPGSRYLKGIPISPVNICSEDELHVLQFNRRAPAEMNLGPTFAEAYAATSQPFIETRPKRYRPEDITEHEPDTVQWQHPLRLLLRRAGLELDLPCPDTIAVVFDNIERVVETDQEGLVVIALTPEYPSRGTELLNKQSKILAEYYKGLPGGNDIVYPSAGMSPNLPILTISEDVPYEQVHKFLGEVKRQGLRSALPVRLSKLVWDTNTKDLE